jgi:SAM-dependent methyltransferase
MPDWQERITRETAPAIRAEHELRYRIAAPLITSSGAWADLGCGNGVAAATAFGGRWPAHMVLVDVEQEVVARAAQELGPNEAVQFVGDLTDAGDLERIGEELLKGQGDRIVTCFEVVEHLHTFLPLLEWAGALARDSAATFAISVPNDAFWSIQNPYHQSAWSEGAFEALRRLLPPEQTLLRQVALTGSAMVGWDAAPIQHELTALTGGDGTVATHFIAAFGPRHGELRSGALAVQTDMLEQRRWERQRESDTAVAQHDVEVAQRQVREHRKAIEAQDRTIASQQATLLEHTKQFDEWRIYIHKLEGELDRPLSGAADEEATA